MAKVAFFDTGDHQFTPLVEVFSGRDTKIPDAELARTDGSYTPKAEFSSRDR